MKVSVVVPCYNVAAYVGRALLSLANQSLHDIEIICVDDASTDNTVAVLKECARLDLRIRIIENDKNMGVGPTRNRGIDAARGEYVAFLDADDWMESTFLEKLVHAAEKYKLPVVCSEVVIHSPDGTILKKDRNDITKNFHYFAYAWSGLYHRGFLNRYNIHFPDLCLGEDSVFESIVKCYVDKPIRLVRGAVYHYCKRLGSLETQVFNTKQINDFCSAFIQIMDIYNSAQNISINDYRAGLNRHWFYLFKKIYFCDAACQEKLAETACNAFARLAYMPDAVYKSYALQVALSSKSVSGVIDVLFSTRWFENEYKLFGVIPFARVRYNKLNKRVFIFGIKVLDRVISAHAHTDQ